MRKILLNVATAVLTFILSVLASGALNAVGDVIVDAIPIDDAPCWEETIILCGIDAQGRPFGVGGETYKLPNCP